MDCDAAERGFAQPSSYPLKSKDTSLAIVSTWESMAANLQPLLISYNSTPECSNLILLPSPLAHIYWFAFCAINMSFSMDHVSICSFRILTVSLISLSPGLPRHLLQYYVSWLQDQNWLLIRDHLSSSYSFPQLRTVANHSCYQLSQSISKASLSV